ncbi:MAG TPA: hypothetical protein VMV96_05245 [Acidimicrobiales bacterium]|nr:hypothetical protein [Acidimicrobiales bacterium]
MATNTVAKTGVERSPVVGLVEAGGPPLSGWGSMFIVAPDR